MGLAEKKNKDGIVLSHQQFLFLRLEEKVKMVQNCRYRGRYSFIVSSKANIW